MGVSGRTVEVFQSSEMLIFLPTGVLSLIIPGVATLKMLLCLSVSKDAASFCFWVSSSIFS